MEIASESVLDCWIKTSAPDDRSTFLHGDHVDALSNLICSRCSANWGSAAQKEAEEDRQIKVHNQAKNKNHAKAKKRALHPGVQSYVYEASCGVELVYIHVSVVMLVLLIRALVSCNF